MITYALYALAAFTEIGGCFAFWAWLHMGKPIWWLVPGMVSLALFGWLLALVPSDAAGRTAFDVPRRGKWQLNVIWTKPCRPWKLPLLV